MNEPKSFRTKTGYCHVLPDRILLNKSETIGDIPAELVKTDLRSLLVGYLILAGLFLYFAVDRFRHDNTMQAIIFLWLGGYLIYGVITSWNNSNTNEISRDRIRKVILKRGIKGLSRSYFEIWFDDSDNVRKRRLIILPGVMARGSEETGKALQIMKDEKLM